MVLGVVFDVDQTLWDFTAVRDQALTAVLAELTDRATVDISTWTNADLQARWDDYAATVTGEKLGTIRRWSLTDAASQAAPGDASLGDELTDLYFSIRHGGGSAYSDVAPALDALRSAGVSLGIVTNGNTDLDLLGLGQFFPERVVVKGSDLGAYKPEPSIYAEVEQRMGMAAKALVCVGDNQQHDVAAPQARGWRGVWNNRDGAALDPAVTPDAIVDTFDELVPIVVDWASQLG